MLDSVNSKCKDEYTKLSEVYNQVELTEFCPRVMVFQ